MFLAWKEIKYAKTRFALIIGVMALVSYLVFFLVGLAYGLSMDNRTAVDKWEADGIVLTDESNININMSMLPQGWLADVEADDVALLGLAPNVVRKQGEEEKINVTFFGVDKDQFIMPTVTEGEAFSADNEVIADRSIQEEFNVEIGDTLKIAGSDMEVTVVGFTEDAKFNVAPVLYSSVGTYQEIRFDQRDDSAEGRISALVVRYDQLEDVIIDNDELRIYPITDYINEIPGYTAQVLTFGLMIGFLIVIAAVVIGIFMYVLTVQKISLFGVMKAQGISTGYIAKSVVAQTFILAVIGVGIGLSLTLITSMVIPPVVPYLNNVIFMATIAALLIIFAIMGAFFSVRTVAKIDPLDAIG